MPISVPSDAGDRLHDVAARILEAKLPGYDQRLYHYCGDLTDPADAARYLRYQLDHLELANVDPAGKAIVDVGCGYGFALLVCGILGAGRLCGIDINPPMIDTIHAYQPLLPPELTSRLQVTRANAAAMPYPDESFDVLLSIEAISHYFDVSRFIDEAARVLRPGGVMIVSDGNNGLNPMIRRKTQRIWDAFELGSSSPLYRDHQVFESYTQMRKRIVRTALPTLDETIASEIARQTSGMAKGEVIEAAREYVENGRLPMHPYRPGQVPVNPINQAVIERLFNPYELASDVESRGFHAFVRGYWGGASGRPLVRVGNRVLSALSRLTIYSALGFRLVAVKSGREV